jgi:signal transduction histidine kinase
VSEDASLLSHSDRQSALDRKIECDLVELTWRTNRVATIVGPFAAAAFLAGVVSDLDPVRLWIWFAVLNSVFVMRAIVLISWSRIKPVGERRLRWRPYFYFGTLLVPLMWGLSGPLFLAQLEPLLQAFLLAIVVGIAGGLIGTISSHKPSILTSLPVMLLPMAGSFIAIGGNIYLILALLIVVYCLYIMNVGLELHRTIRDSLRLRFERSELIEQLRTARDEAEEANEAKSSFLANMSHELRTPLNAILGFSEMIKLGMFGKKSEERQIEYAGFIHDSGTHLLDLINDILDLSKAEAGALELHEEKFRLRPLVESCIQLLAPAAGKAGIEVVGPVGKAAGPALFADERKLRQILLNLLSNAMKFTPAGGRVTVSYEVAGNGELGLAIADTGVGLTPRQLEMAMQPFVQVDGSYSKSAQGTGLGLPLTLKLTELHGGRLEMRSSPGKGTTAIVHLPAERLIEAKTPRKRAIG